jgi:membrane-associated peptidase rhomboid family
MAYILLLGPMLEEKHGPMKIIEVIAVTALVTGVINYVSFGIRHYVVLAVLYLHLF